MLKLAENAAFKECTPLSERLEDERYRHELILRFLSFTALR